MAGLALGLVGGFFFGPVGYLIGSTLGNLLFPPHGQDAQPLQNLKLQGSAYGTMIPIPYGTIRLGGQVVWQTDLVPHAQHDSGGGKGGSDPISGYTYTVSCAIKVCKSIAGGGFRRIWADGELIYDTTTDSTTDNDALPIVFYLGVETALPDPTIEAVKGVGNVPAFRDDAAVVLTDWDVTRYGNRIPQLNFEVFTAAGARPWRVSTYDRLGGNDGQNMHSAIENNGDGTTTNVWLDWQPTDAVGGLITEVRKIDGTLVSTAEITIDSYNGLHFFRTSPCFNNVHILEITAASNTFDDYGAWYYDGSLVAKPINGGGQAEVVFEAGSVFYNDNVYAIGGNTSPVLARYPSPGGVTSGDSDISFSLNPAANSFNWAVCVSDDGFIWVGDKEGLGRLIKLDADLNVVHDYGTSGPLIIGYNFVVYQNMICFPTPEIPLGAIWVARLQSIDEGGTFTQIGELHIAAGDLISIGGGLVSVRDGIISLAPPAAGITLASIVSDVSDRCGRASTEIDVSTLTDIVDGYMVTQRSSGRSIIDPLRNAYFFDPVESNTQIKFVKRGAAAVITIPDEDLAASSSADERPALLTTERAEEELLPAKLDLKWVNAAADYQDGNTRAWRETTSSEMAITMELAISMSKAKAAQVAWVNLLLAWTERDSFNLSTTRKYAYLEPTDVVIAHGRTMRLTKETQSASLVNSFEALAVLPQLYQTAPVGAGEGLGFTQSSAARRQATTVLLLDIPLIKDSDQPGYYAAMSPAAVGSWPGAILKKSSDGGTTYDTVASVTSPATIGAVATAIGDFRGGNVFDEGNTITVVIGPGGGTLSSATRLAVLNGSNKAMLGSEMLQFRDATLTGTNTYVLSGLRRGIRGTEWAIGTHSANENFVLLSTVASIASAGDLGVTRPFKAITMGGTLAGAPAVSFTNFGAALRPYSVVHVGGGVNASGDFLINWVRRTRIGGEWASFSVAPLSESSEEYSVDVYASDFTTLKRSVTGLTTQTMTYTAAQQTTDFGAPQSSVYLKVYQHGSFLPSKATRATIPNADPIPPTADLEPNPIPGPPPPLPVAVNAIPITWAGAGLKIVYSIDYGGFGPTDQLVISFTTPSSGNVNVGNITIVEFSGDPITPRLACLSTTAGDMQNGIKKEGQGPTFFFSVGSAATVGGYPVPTLALNTTYYLNVKNGPTDATSCNVKVTLNKPSGL